MAEQLDWHVAVYASNEAARIGDCLGSVAAAMGARRYRVAAVVNGSRDGTAEAALDEAKRSLPVEVQVIAHGDKANAINRFIHDLRRPARFIGQVDAYAIVGLGTFTGMEHAFARHPDAVAATDEMIATLASSGILPPASGRGRYFRRLALRRVASFVRPDPLSLLPRPLA